MNTATARKPERAIVQSDGIACPACEGQGACSLGHDHYGHATFGDCTPCAGTGIARCEVCSLRAHLTLDGTPLCVDCALDHLEDGQVAA